MSNMIKATMTGAALATVLLTASCSNSPLPVESQLTPKTTTSEAVSTFPYNPIVYHLDLSILAYQLYGQSLVWPFDPYYEEHGGKKGDREGIMKKVQQWANQVGIQQIKTPSALNSYRGPGSLGGFSNNSGHDPIIYNYAQLYPWSNALTNADGTWVEYLTPNTITSRIKSVFVCQRPAGGTESAVVFNELSNGKSGASAGATNTLLAFEGGTGDKGEVGQPASQSLMGFILLREKEDGAYDVHISFRGSRSGSTGRAALEAFSDDKASGNPDWITDLGYNRLSANQGTAHISTVGKVHRGFARSMRSIHPNLFHCLDKAAGMKNGTKPDNIYVTGHSLGGALAQAFVSSVLLGNEYGPNGTGKSLPSSLSGWPWKNIKLISFSAPRIGDATFAERLTVDSLQSEFFSTPFNPIDLKAYRPNNPAILSRLLNPARPAAYRVLHSKDPITTEKGAGGKHVGKTVYVNNFSIGQLVSGPDFSAHEQWVIRDNMLENLSSSKIPKNAMRYRTMAEINPDRVKDKKGSAAEMSKMAAALKKYYTDTATHFDHATFDRDFDTRMQIEQGQ